MTHGFVLAYRGGCRCDPCRGAQRRYRQALARSRAARPQLHVDAGPARAHLKALATMGWGRRALAKRLAISQRRLLDLRDGTDTFVSLDLAGKILAIPKKKARTATVSSWNTWKMIKALYAEGYTASIVANGLGRTDGRLRFKARVRVGTERRVAHIYRQLMGDPDA